MSTNRRVAVVTGADRGLGFETCRQLAEREYLVVLTSRNREKGQAATLELENSGYHVVFHPLDVNNFRSIDDLRTSVEQRFERVDVLVNNAGIWLDSSGPDEYRPAMRTRIEVLQQSMETNAFGPFQLCQELIPLMLKNGYGRIVNVSTGLAQLSEMEGGWPGYRISKVALNAITRIFADEMRGTNILINSVTPGWVRTDMGGPHAERSIDEGAKWIVWAATLPDGSPTGQFFRDDKPIAW